MSFPFSFYRFLRNIVSVFPPCVCKFVLGKCVFSLPIISKWRKSILQWVKVLLQKYSILVFKKRKICLVLRRQSEDISKLNFFCFQWILSRTILKQLTKNWISPSTIWHKIKVFSFAFKVRCIEKNFLVCFYRLLFALSSDENFALKSLNVFTHRSFTPGFVQFKSFLYAKLSLDTGE